MRPSKKEQILQLSLKLFYQNGFHATGVDFLVKETGISKTTIYSHFESKEELMLAVLQRRDKDFMNWISNRVNELSNSVEAKLLCIFDVLEEWFKQSDFSSCMFIKASSEFQDPSHPIYLQAMKHKQNLLSYFEQLAMDANYTNSKEVARQLLILKEGAIIAAHLKLMPKPGLEAKQMFTQLVSK